MGRTREVVLSETSNGRSFQDQDTKERVMGKKSIIIDCYQTGCDWTFALTGDDVLKEVQDAYASHYKEKHKSSSKEDRLKAAYVRLNNAHDLVMASGGYRGFNEYVQARKVVLEIRNEKPEKESNLNIINQAVKEGLDEITKLESRLYPRNPETFHLRTCFYAIKAQVDNGR